MNLEELNDDIDKFITSSSGSTTREFINNITGSDNRKPDASKHKQLFESFIGNEIFINKLENKIIEYLNKENKSNINGYTFDGLVNHNINYSEKFKCEIIKFLKNVKTQMGKRNYLLIATAIESFKLKLQDLNYLKDIDIEEIIGNRNSVIGFFDNQTVLKIIKSKPLLLQHIKNQTLEICLEAVKSNGLALQYVKDQTPDICLEAVKSDPLALQYVKDQTPDICLEAVKSNPSALRYVKDQTPEICLEAVKSNGMALQYVKDQTPEICLEAAKSNGMALQYVKDQTPEICLEAVKSNGMALRYVKDQTPEICLEAVKSNGIALLYVKDQTPEICLKAVKSNGMALQYVKDQTPEICLEAAKSNGMALQYVKDQTPEICLEAVKSNGMALRYVKDQTPEICLEAVKSNGLSLEYVKNEFKTEIICTEAVKSNGKSINWINIDDNILFNKVLDTAFEKDIDYKELLKLNSAIIADKNKKIKRLDSYFSKYIYYLLSNVNKTNNLESYITSKNYTLKLNTNIEYFHSFVLQDGIAPNEIFNTDKFIWFSSQFDQSFLHLFNNARTLSNIQSNTLINLFIAKFRLSKEIKILKSKSSVNDNIFKNIIPDDCLSKILDALHDRHKYFLEIEKPVGWVPDAYYTAGDFAGEQNKFILIILKELNKFILEETNKIYGYINEQDQNEIALLSREGLIDLTSLKFSKYTRVIKKNSSEIIFPVMYKKYHDEFYNENVTLYSNMNKLGNESTHYGNIKNCMKNRGKETDSFRMWKYDNTKIFYQDFEDTSRELEFKNLNVDDYWKQKYLKYKAKYLALKSKVN